MPERRFVTYITKLGLPSSPSLTMSMPASACFATHSDTAERTRSANTFSSTASPFSRAWSMARRSAGRDKLPVCVVKMRSVLRFIQPHIRGSANSPMLHSRERPGHAPQRLRRPPRSPCAYRNAREALGAVARDEHRIGDRRAPAIPTSETRLQHEHHALGERSSLAGPQTRRFVEPAADAVAGVARRAEAVCPRRHAAVTDDARGRVGDAR